MKVFSLDGFHSDRQKQDKKCSWCKDCKIKKANAHYELNKGKIAAAHRIKHLINKESINRSRRKYPEISGQGEFNRINPNHFDFGASTRKPVGESSFARLMRQYKSNAARRSIEFNLSEIEVRTLTKLKCSYCGVEPRQIMQSEDSNGSYIYNGIDRVDSTKGYFIDNCVPACKTCNKAKSTMSLKDWHDWLDRIVVFHTAAGVGFKKTLGDDGHKGQ
jgi:hypothetical protein